MLVLGLCTGILAQEKPHPPCPAISVTGPAGIIMPGGSMTFVAHVAGLPDSKEVFKWTLSAGTSL